jgi:hypothetical protein
MQARVSGRRSVAVLAVAILAAGALAASSAGAAAPLTKAKVKKIATKVFNKKIGPATAGLQAKCQQGAVMGSAYIDGAIYPDVNPGDPFSPVSSGWSCFGNGTVQVRKVGVGFYDVNFGLPAPCGMVHAVATRAQSIGVIRTFPVTDGSSCILDTRTQDVSGSFNEGVFTIVLIRP